jgi:hypothetical protein
MHMDREELDAGVKMLRAPRAAGVAGIAFSLLLGLAIVLLRISTPSNQTQAGVWLTDSGRRETLVVGLSLIPFAGIAFLWFMGVVRDRIGEREDRFVATVFLGSGLLFVAMLFAGAAVAGAVAATAGAAAGGPLRADLLETERRISQQLLEVYALRMAGVFVISTTTIAFRTGILPRWLGVFGYASALILLVNSGRLHWVNLVFPLWALVLSIHILRVAPKA